MTATEAYKQYAKIHARSLGGHITEESSKTYGVYYRFKKHDIEIGAASWCELGLILEQIKTLEPSLG